MRYLLIICLLFFQGCSLLIAPDLDEPYKLTNPNFKTPLNAYLLKMRNPCVNCKAHIRMEFWIKKGLPTDIINMYDIPCSVCKCKTLKNYSDLKEGELSYYTATAYHVEWFNNKRTIYTKRIECGNCKKDCHIEIPIGITIVEHTSKLVCDNCGTKGRFHQWLYLE